MNPVSRRVLPFVVLAGLAAPAFAAAIDFNFKDPKGVNAMYFVLESQLEPIMGLAGGIAGQVSYDPAEPGKISGRITVAADSLRTGNKRMDDVLHGPDWLNVKENPEISFTFKSASKAKKVADATQEFDAVGEFSCNGVTKELTVPVRATYQKGRLGDRLRGKQGDILVLRTNFSIKRSDFKIKPDMGEPLVADEIQIRASIVGAHEAP